MEEYRNELLQGLVGHLVLVKQLVAPEADAELYEAMRENLLMGKGQELRSRTATAVLESYDHVGVVLRQPTTDPEESVFAFVPWGAVIELSSMGQEEEQQQQQE